MTTSINFDHTSNTIFSSNDGLMFKKFEYGWQKIGQTLYKSESTYPTTEGNNGDYYAKYLKKYNHMLYSEDFTQNVWNKDLITVNKEPSIIFPSTESTKMMAYQSLGEHTLTYVLDNTMGKYFTFSLYVKPNELNRIQIALADTYGKSGYKAFANFEDSTIEIKSFGDVKNSETLGANIKKIVVKYSEKVSFNYFRIWITAKFDKAARLQAIIKLLDNNGNETFIPEDETTGLFINGAQLSQNTVPEDYIQTSDTFEESLYLEHLYCKENDEWNIVDNTILNVSTNDLNDNVGNVGDIVVSSGIIKILPALLAGNGSTSTVLNRPLGTIRYSRKDEKWYVQAKKGKEYSLEYVHNKPSYSKVAMALTLNQNIYQTYSKHCQNNFSKRFGLNNGGNYNNWNRFHKN